MSTNQNWTDDEKKSAAGIDPSSQSSGGGKEPDQDEDKKKKKGVFIAIAAAVALLLLGLGGVGIYSAVKGGGAAAVERDNMLSLIQRYMDRGEYDRALDLLEDLLIKNANDMEALALLEEAMSRMAAEDGISDSDLEELFRRLAESGGLDALGGIQGLDDLRALLEAANRNNATMNELLRQQQGQGRAGAGGAGGAGGAAGTSGSGSGSAGGISSMSQDEVADRIDQMMKSGDYKGLENMDSDEFARLMQELAADGV